MTFCLCIDRISDENVMSHEIRPYCMWREWHEVSGDTHGVHGLSPNNFNPSSLLAWRRPDSTYKQQKRASDFDRVHPSDRHSFLTCQSILIMCLNLLPRGLLNIIIIMDKNNKQHLHHGWRRWWRLGNVLIQICRINTVSTILKLNNWKYIKECCLFLCNDLVKVNKFHRGKYRILQG